MDLKDLLKDIEKYIDEEVTISGWIRNHRKQKEFGFIDFSDGTSFNHLQLVYTNKLANFEEIAKYPIGAAITATGRIIKSEGAGQDYELSISNIKLEGDCDEDYPLQAKGRPTREFLREQAYIRPRTNLFQAVFKIRSVAAMAIHEYFQNNNYVYVHTPLLTTAACEDPDQMFKITTLDMNNIKKVDGQVDWREDLFNKPTYITGSGQLQGETFALAFKKIYTFGPTFRTENSNTKTHANEFWMIEPEIAFCDLDHVMDIEEEMLKYIVKYVLDKCSDEIEFLNKFVDSTLKEKLTKLLDSNFVRITHHDAITLLKNSGVNFEFNPDYDDDIAKEHEKYITEYYNSPVFITNWPKDIKAWYMKENPDHKTVAAVDLEVPGAGELIGGSQREDDYDKLVARAKEMNVDVDTVDWYMNLRRFGGCYHSGFGMGFERLIMYLTGVENIRDVIPYPRTPGNCEY